MFSGYSYFFTLVLVFLCVEISALSYSDGGLPLILSKVLQDKTCRRQEVEFC